MMMVAARVGILGKQEGPALPSCRLAQNLFTSLSF
jgi:hypothetical protein